jgi:hypothetical protein
MDQKTKVSRRAILARIQRKIAKDGQILKIARDTKTIIEWGVYLIIDSRQNKIVNHFHKLDHMEYDYQVLKPYEEMYEEDL